MLNALRLAAGASLTWDQLIAAVYPDPDRDEPEQAVAAIRRFGRLLRDLGYPVERVWGLGFRFVPTFHQIGDVDGKDFDAARRPATAARGGQITMLDGSPCPDPFDQRTAEEHAALQRRAERIAGLKAKLDAGAEAFTDEGLDHLEQLLDHTALPAAEGEGILDRIKRLFGFRDGEGAAEIADLKEQIAGANKMIENLRGSIDEAFARRDAAENALASAGAELENHKAGAAADMAAADKALENARAQIAERDAAIADKDALIASLRQPADNQTTVAGDAGKAGDR